MQTKNCIMFPLIKRNLCCESREYNGEGFSSSDTRRLFCEWNSFWYEHFSFLYIGCTFQCRCCCAIAIEFYIIFSCCRKFGFLFSFSNRNYIKLSAIRSIDIISDVIHLIFYVVTRCTYVRSDDILSYFPHTNTLPFRISKSNRICMYTVWVRNGISGFMMRE